MCLTILLNQGTVGFSVKHQQSFFVDLLEHPPNQALIKKFIYCAMYFRNHGFFYRILLLLVMSGKIVILK